MSSGSNDKELERGGSHGEQAEQLRLALTNTMSLAPDMFERVYLGPKGKVAGDLRKRFANPTPLALLGFSVALLPLACEFMGWRGAGGQAAATTTCSIWFGGILLLLAGIGEFLIGNTFPFLVFMGYGAHFLTFSMSLIPWFHAVAAYNQSGSPQDITPTFAASFGYYPVSLMLLSIVYLIGSLRTNVVFVGIFAFASTGFGCAIGSYWHLSEGNMVAGNKLAVGVGACFFGAAILGWYLFLAEVIIIMELPIPDLPVFDLSTVIKARPRKTRKED